MILVPMYVVCSFSAEPSFWTLFSDPLKCHGSTPGLFLILSYSYLISYLFLILPLCDPQSEAFLHLWEVWLRFFLKHSFLSFPFSFYPRTWGTSFPIAQLPLHPRLLHVLSPLRTTLDCHPTHRPAFQGSIPVFGSAHQKSGKSQPFQRLSPYQTLF